MELKRLARAVSERWTLVVGLSLLGVVAALVLGGLANRNSSEAYQATAAIRFNPTEGQTIADLADDIAEAEALAYAAAADLLANTESFIAQDLSEARLLFVAQGTSMVEAQANASELRQSYLNVDPLVGGAAISERLQEIQDKAGEVQAEIDALQPEAPDADTPEGQQRELLLAQIGAVTDRLVQLAVAEGSATDAATRQEIDAERRSQEENLRDLRAQLAELPDPPTPSELTPAESLQLTSLQAQLDALAADHQRLTLRQEGVTDEGLEPITVLNLTPEPLPPVATASIGLLGGLLVAVLALVFINRTRAPVWLSDDIRLQVLASVPTRRVSFDVLDNWYQTAEPGPRKDAVQALRAAVEVHVTTSGPTIALTGLSTDPQGVQALASDLASSMASAGFTVLLVDANFSSRSSVGMYRGGDSALSSVLSMSPVAPDFKAHVAHTIEQAQHVVPGLAVVPSGPAPTSPADALAGRQFRELIAEGRERFDVVLVVVDDIDTPSAQVAIQRLGAGLLVMTPGASTRAEVDRVLRDVDRLHISLLGAVFLEKQGRILPTRNRPTRVEPERVVEPAGEDARPSPVSRLSSYPIPQERKSPLSPHGSLDGFAANLGTSASEMTTSTGLANGLIAAMRSVDPARAASSVIEYLVSQTEDMVLARPGQSGLSDDLTAAMAEFGFMTLKPLKGLDTASGWLKREIADNVGQSEAAALVEEMERILGRGSPRSIDAWMADEFFHRHLERMQGEPEVWQLVSHGGAVALLVPARGLSAQSLDSIAVQVVGRALDDSSSDDPTTADAEDSSETFVDDVRSFQRTVSRLVGSDEGLGGGGPGSGAWQPDWTRGSRHNLAPLQRLGLLPFDVLSAEEMSKLLVST